MTWGRKLAARAERAVRGWRRGRLERELDRIFSRRDPAEVLERLESVARRYGGRVSLLPGGCSHHPDARPRVSYSKPAWAIGSAARRLRARMSRMFSAAKPVKAELFSKELVKIQPMEVPACLLLRI